MTKQQRIDKGSSGRNALGAICGLVVLGLLAGCGLVGAGAPSSTPTLTVSATPTPLPGPSHRMYLLPSEIIVRAGETFSATVMVSSTDMIRGAQTGLTFNPELVEVVAWEEGAHFRDWAKADDGDTTIVPEPEIDNVRGGVSVTGVAIWGGANNDDGPTGAGMLLTYYLRAKEEVTGETVLRLAEAMVADPAGDIVPDLMVTDGQVKVVPGDPVPTTVAAGPTATPCPTCPTMALLPSTVAVNAGDTFTVSAVISSATMVRGVQVGLLFDPAQLEVTGWEEGSFLRNWAEADGGRTMVVPQPIIDNEHGTVSLVGLLVFGGAHRDEGPKGTGAVMIYHVKVKPDASGASSLTLGGGLGEVFIADPDGDLPADLVIQNAEVHIGTQGMNASGQ